MNKEATNNPGGYPQGLVLRWAGKSVDINNVEDELALLWRISADNMRRGQNTDVRTSILNLVICAPDIESAQRASALLRDLSTTHLARVNLLILDRSNTTPAAISTWVTLRCFSVFSDLMRHCFEQTTLLATGAAVRSIANILQPLLKPDLPVYLWWIGDPPDNDSMFSSLVEFSNRVIVDSTSFYNPEQDILTLAQLSQASPDCALSDLNWGRITPWRQLIAQFFDVMEYRPYLAGITSIEIEHAAAPLAIQTRTEQGDVSPNPACALLLAGWLKARLGWSLSADSTRGIHDTASGTYHWQLERTAAPATRVLSSTRSKAGKPPGTAPAASIYIRPQVQSNMRPGSICLVRLTSNVEGKQATFTINREGDPDHVLTSVVLSHETRPQRTVSLAAAHKESELLHDELAITGHDYLFEETLQEMAELLG
ncbi:MAG: glucose-6-phosphate dehydrogenase assembly protein OpcA [Ktedonobacteraceae bacterium]